LIFNGANADEIMTVTTLANGGFQFFRNVGDITVGTTNVERVDVDGLRFVGIHRELMTAAAR
jgi:hypothetical protein